MTENSRNYHAPSHIFEVKHSEISNAKFDELRQDMDVLYGYHGSRVENFYSILNNGLHAHLNKVCRQYFLLHKLASLHYLSIFPLRFNMP